MSIQTLLARLQHRTMIFAPDEGAGGGTATVEPAPPADGGAAGVEPKKPVAEPKVHEETVPYDRFKSTLEAQKAAEKAASDAKAELARMQRAGMPELDRLKAERDELARQVEEANGKATAAEQRATTIERGGWVRAAASAAGFHDVEDAIARIDVANVRTEDGARRAVEQLADSAKHLVKPKDDASQGGVLREVLAGGKPKDAAEGAERKLVPAAELEAMSQDQHLALLERDADLYHRSLAAASAA